MKTRILYLILLCILLAAACSPGMTAAPQPAQASVPQATGHSTPVAKTSGSHSGQKTPAANDSRPAQPSDGRTPPQEAIQACTGKSEQAACEFTWQKGTEAGVCETVQGQLACSPKHSPGEAGQPSDGSNPDDDHRQGSGNRPGVGGPAGGAAYNIEQAISDKAQGMTIAFDALAFLTGDLGSDSFFPPGKVADFWGFQYLRDNDASQMGHAGDFLTSAALNVLTILTSAQRDQLVALAESQVEDINQYAYNRFVLMDAFRRLSENNLPAGTAGLDETAVKAYSANLYRLDGKISFARAQLMGSLINSLDATQRAALNNMVGQGMRTWPDVEEPADIRGLDRDVKVAVMTYAADLFSWYAGSVEADVYFCPERHGTYFGSFYLKDRPAMDDSGYAIPTDMTGNMGEEMLGVLTLDQAQQVTGLVDIQRPYLQEIVDIRQKVSTELRKFKDGGTADQETVLNLMGEYGERDGEIIYNLAVHFVAVGQSLTEAQKAQMMALRKEMLGEQMHPNGAYLYSQPIAMPEIPNTDFLFK